MRCTHPIYQVAKEETYGRVKPDTGGVTNGDLADQAGDRGRVVH